MPSLTLATSQSSLNSTPFETTSSGEECLASSLDQQDEGVLLCVIYLDVATQLILDVCLCNRECYSQGEKVAFAYERSTEEPGVRIVLLLRMLANSCFPLLAIRSFDFWQFRHI